MKILLLNGAQEFSHAGGMLNNTLHAEAVKTLSRLGHEIQETHIEKGYDATGEVKKILWADALVFQMAGWWMGLPWKTKKYIDEVYTAGNGKLYADDGRTRSDPGKQYGTGGLLQGRRYMLSVTWNAPEEAFEEYGNFFDGRGVDGVYFPFHKAQQFVGLEALPSFLAADVIKAPDVPETLRRYGEHLTEVFSSSGCR